MVFNNLLLYLYTERWNKKNKVSLNKKLRVYLEFWMSDVVKFSVLSLILLEPMSSFKAIFKYVNSILAIEEQ